MLVIYVIIVVGSLLIKYIMKKEDIKIKKDGHNAVVAVIPYHCYQEIITLLRLYRSIGENIYELREKNLYRLEELIVDMAMGQRIPYEKYPSYRFTEDDVKILQKAFEFYKRLVLNKFSYDAIELCREEQSGTVLCGAKGVNNKNIVFMTMLLKKIKEELKKGKYFIIMYGIKGNCNDLCVKCAACESGGNGVGLIVKTMGIDALNKNGYYIEYSYKSFEEAKRNESLIRTIIAMNEKMSDKYGNYEIKIEKM